MKNSSFHRIVILFFFVLLALPLFELSEHSVWAKSKEKSFSIVVPPNRTLRSIAGEYLGDPNLWTEILRVNKFDSPDQVEAGKSIKIPLNEITLANSKLSSSATIINKATKEGAQLFARQLINQAVELRNQAQTARQKSEWKQTLTLATEAEKMANAALKKAKELREVAAQATLKNHTGTVQRRTPVALGWNSIITGAILKEKEKVRTLSDSTATLLFVDSSRLQISENSQAVIQSMQVDRLNNKKSVKVSLTQGDVFALLGKSKKQKSMDIKVPGISIDGESNHFWMSRKKKNTLIANYAKQTMKVFCCRTNSKLVAKSRNHH